MLDSVAGQYFKLHEAQENARLYTSPWWLDAVCGKNQWTAIFKQDEAGRVIAALPFYATKIRGLSANITPPLTQWVSIIGIASGDFQYWYQRIPRAVITDINIHPLGADLHFQYLPVTTRYSYVLPYAENLSQMMSGYNEGLRRNLKSGQAIFNIEKSDDIPTFIRLFKNTFQQQSLKSPWWVEALAPGLAKVLFEKERGQLTFAKKGDTPIAALLTAWDHGSVYYIAGGRASSEEGTSAHALLLDDAIRLAHAHKCDFDFEGSMIPGIANFFQSFGAKPVPLNRVRKYRGLGKLWHLFQ